MGCTWEDQPRARAGRLSFALPDDDGQAHDYTGFRAPNEQRLDAVDTRRALEDARLELAWRGSRSHAARKHLRAH